MKLADYNNEFGDIDLFLLDLLLKGYINEDAKILDAGCGSGRNTFFFLKQGYNVSAIDMLKAEVNATNFMSRTLGCGDVALLGNLIDLPYDDQSFDLIVCSRVLHFVESEQCFDEIMLEFFRVLTPTGILYLSMNSSIGFEQDAPRVNIQNHFLLTPQLINNLKKLWPVLLDERTILFGRSNSETTLILKK